MTYIGKLWLTDGRTLVFSWYPEFFQARAFHEKRKQLVRSMFVSWGRK